MKKLLVVLLSLGLLAAFSLTASAADVKFSGQYYVSGVYENNRTLRDADQGPYSKAYFWTRTRVQTVFQVAEGLSFTTRFDAFERQWGSVNRSSNTTEDKSNSGKVNSIGTTLQENLEMEYAYVTFMTRIGQFQIGYQAADEWGTGYADTPGSRPRAIFSTAFGPLTLMAVYEKWFEADTNRLQDRVTVTATGTAAVSVATAGNTSSGLVDSDTDTYALAAIYNFKGGNAGLLWKYFNVAQTRTLAAQYRAQTHYIAPYMKATFGPVYVEAELAYLTGKSAKYDNAGNDIDREGMGAYVLAKVNLGPAYVGGQIGYTSGDPNDTTKDKSGPNSSTSWTPALIFGNANLRSWNYGADVGGAGTVPSYNNNTKQNLMLYNLFAGFNPTAKLNVEAAFTYATADKAPNSFVSKNYGMEGDLKATYKIYDNLTYMVGAGYFVTGDFFKGTSDNNKVGNDYILLNQLTLNF